VPCVPCFSKIEREREREKEKNGQKEPFLPLHPQLFIEIDFDDVVERAVEQRQVKSVARGVVGAALGLVAMCGGF
jgi:hypothetical protein